MVCRSLEGGRPDSDRTDMFPETTMDFLSGMELKHLVMIYLATGGGRTESRSADMKEFAVSVKPLIEGKSVGRFYIKLMWMGRQVALATMHRFDEKTHPRIDIRVSSLNTTSVNKSLEEWLSKTFGTNRCSVVKDNVYRMMPVPFILNGSLATYVDVHQMSVGLGDRRVCEVRGVSVPPGTQDKKDVLWRIVNTSYSGSIASVVSSTLEGSCSGPLRALRTGCPGIER